MRIYIRKSFSVIARSRICHCEVLRSNLDCRACWLAMTNRKRELLMKFEPTKKPPYRLAFQPRAEGGAAYSLRTPTRRGSIRLLFNLNFSKNN